MSFGILCLPREKEGGPPEGEPPKPPSDLRRRKGRTGLNPLKTLFSVSIPPFHPIPSNVQEPAQTVRNRTHNGVRLFSGAAGQSLTPHEDCPIYGSFGCAARSILGGGES